MIIGLCIEWKAGRDFCIAERNEGMEGDSCEKEDGWMGINMVTKQIKRIRVRKKGMGGFR